MAYQHNQCKPQAGGSVWLACVCVSAVSHSLHPTPSSMSAPATKALSLTCLYLCRLGAHRPLVVYRGMSEAAGRESGDYSEM